MSEQENKIIAFVGLAGAGKSTAVKYLTDKGYPKVYFGGITLEAMRQANIEITPDNEREFTKKIREKKGKDFVVKRIIAQIHELIDAGQHRIVADGLYSWTEYKAMKHEFPGELTTIAVVSNKHIRHHRLENRPVRPMSIEEADKRDWSEIENLEKGGPIAIADYYLINNGTEEELYKQIDDVMEKIEFY